MKKMITIAFSLTFILNSFAQNLDDTPWKMRTPAQKFLESSYEDEFTYKHKEIFFKDPFIWVVSNEFSERFGMPKAWIDEGLQGAFAVAWRITKQSGQMCGHGNNPLACWSAPTCQMDIYVDNAAPIPWRFNDVQRDFFWRGMTSMSYVPMRAPAPSRGRYLEVYSPLENKGRPFYKTNLLYKSGSQGGGAFNIIYFDRTYAPGITVLGFEDACPSRGEKGGASLKFFTEEEQHRTAGNIEHYVHSVDFPPIFMQRMTQMYTQTWEDSKKSNAVYQDIVKEYLPH